MFRPPVPPFPASLATVPTAVLWQTLTVANIHTQIHAKYTQNTHIHIPYTHSLTGPRIETNLNECSAASHGGTTWNETVTVRLRPQHERFANLSDISEANLSEYLKFTFDIFDVWFSFKLFNT